MWLRIIWFVPQNIAGWFSCHLFFGPGFHRHPMKELEQDMRSSKYFMAARKVSRLFQMRWGLTWREWVRSQRDNDTIVIQQNWQQMRKKLARRKILNWDLAGEASAWSCPTNHISLIFYKDCGWNCESKILALFYLEAAMSWISNRFVSKVFSNYSSQGLHQCGHHYDDDDDDHDHHNHDHDNDDHH